MKKNVLLLTVLMISVLCAKAQEPAYRPMVEKGKVWKVGWIPSGSDEANVGNIKKGESIGRCFSKNAESIGKNRFSREFCPKSDLSTFWAILSTP